VSRRLGGRARSALVGFSLLLFVVLFKASYFFICSGCQ